MSITNEFEGKLKKKVDGISFSFGKNWLNYLNSLTKERILNAKESMKSFLGDVKNKRFIDVGCGSGLFSFIANSLGANEVISFDIDPFSVQCALYLRSKVKNPRTWNIFQGSILDKSFISNLGKYDIVYSWGVLHHTGKMWNAIKNATSLVADNGLFYIAIYNKTSTSKYWLRIKQIYNKSPKIIKIVMNYGLFSIMYFFYPLIKLKSPFNEVREYQKNRGMNPIIDVKDWLGGYPFEYATFKEISDFVQKIDLNFKLVKYKVAILDGNNEFLFKKKMQI